MAGKREAAVARPTKLTEYELFFADAAAQRGWVDLRATAKNALADAWDYLTEHPTKFDANRCYQLRGDSATALIDGIPLPHWQYKITNGGRLWYAVDEPSPKTKTPGRVIITRAATGHPNETDSAKNFR